MFNFAAGNDTRALRTTLNDVVRGNNFLPHVACHDKSSAQLTVHAAQRLQHARV